MPMHLGPEVHQYLQPWLLTSTRCYTALALSPELLTPQGECAHLFCVRQGEPFCERLRYSRTDRSLVARSFRQMYEMANGIASGPGDHGGQQRSNCEEMILETLSRLVAGPVHEETELRMNHEDSPEHNEDD